MSRMRRVGSDKDSVIERVVNEPHIDMRAMAVEN
jgi:hypothetical protein